MSLLKKKLHCINKSGEEVTYNLFSSPADWNNATTTTFAKSPCLHAVIDDNKTIGYCPVITIPGINTGNINIATGNTWTPTDGSSQPVCYTPMNIATAAIKVTFSNNSTTTSNYTTVYTKVIDKIERLYPIDYDLKIVFYNGSGTELYAASMNSDTISLSNLNAPISSSNGFFWSVYVPSTYIYRTITFSKNQFNIYINGSAVWYADTGSFTATVKDYDGTIIDSSNVYTRIYTSTILASAADHVPNPYVQVGGWNGASVSNPISTLINTATISMKIYVKTNDTYDTTTLKYKPSVSSSAYTSVTCHEVLSRSNTLYGGWFGNIYFSLPTTYFDKQQTSGQTDIFTKETISTTATTASHSIPLTLNKEYGDIVWS